MSIVNCPSGCRRSGGVVGRDDRPRSSVVIANPVCHLASPFGRGVMR
ncbi:MAG: hypothetical protein FWH14_07005 [Oscillospiraceae bacterium]|nr:hypothetical protein [Oscillospiraceae bacterium]